MRSRLLFGLLAASIMLTSSTAADAAKRRPPAMKYDDAFPQAELYVARAALRAQNRNLGSLGTKVVEGNVGECLRVGRRAFNCSARYDTTKYYDSGRVGMYTCTETVAVRFRRPTSIFIVARTSGDFKCDPGIVSNG